MRTTWTRATSLGLTTTLICLAHVSNLGQRIRKDERGDVPGWVMITFMNRA